MAQHNNAPTQPQANETHVAGAFDIRNFIGVLIGIYGIILLGCGFFGDTPADSLKQSSDNLWAGGIMTLAGICFILWAKLRPVVIDQEAKDKE
ncbi:MAG: hypothetical protein Q3976_01105 [Corynebacterium sp.]|nr:hypothetical protein [Corynebacterium sp.]